VSDASALKWGTSDSITALDTLMWRADTDRTMRSTVMAIEILDLVPDWDRLVDAHDWATRMAPRLRERVAEPLGFAGTPIWQRDERFDPHYHLRRCRLGGDADWAELLATASQLAMTPFDRTRPLWEATLVEGLPDGRAAYLLKLHHALSDGLGIRQLLSQLHSRQRSHRPDKPQPALQAPLRPATPVTRELKHTVAAVPGMVSRAASLLLGGAADPVRATRAAVRYVESARRVLAPPAVEGLPTLRQRGGTWNFVALDLDVADLRAAARAVNASMNDAYLASLLGGFRRYHEEIGFDLAESVGMPVSVPVSVRRDDDGAGGNRFAPARLIAPVGVADPAERVRLVRELVRHARTEPALDSAELVAPLMARLPSSLLVAIAGSATAGNDLQASNVPGVEEDLYLAGALIERVYPFAPLPGCAAMITMYTYRGGCFIGANIDSAAIEDRALFARCLAEGFAEVLALAPGASKPRLLA
jgi:diacylglycerol O-acyltransferase